MSKTTVRPPNGPSTTGNPSGPVRGNNPPGKPAAPSSTPKTGGK